MKILTENWSIKVRKHTSVLWQIASYKLHNANTNKLHNSYLRTTAIIRVRVLLSFIHCPVTTFSPGVIEDNVNKFLNYRYVYYSPQ